MTRDRSLIRLTRSGGGALIAVVLAFAVAAPAAAAQPTRTVVPTPLVTHYPAGTGCDFDVTVYRSPGMWNAFTDFNDGRHMAINHVIGRRITNDATGATFVENSVAHQVYTTVNGQDVGTSDGQFILQFYPGDVGPDGVILDHILALYVQGTARFVVDDATGATLAITISGTVTDICAAIS